jgi:hypothetical protein
MKGERGPADEQTRAAERRNHTEPFASAQRQRKKTEAEQQRACGKAPARDGQRKPEPVARLRDRRNRGQRCRVNGILPNSIRY